jgi:hypothetical protein
VTLAAARVTGELAEVVRQAGREQHDALAAAPAAGNA